MSYTGMESQHKLNCNSVIVPKIRQYNRGQEIDYDGNWDQWSNTAEDVTSDFRFSAPTMVNQMRHPAVMTTQQQLKQDIYANVVQNGEPKVKVKVKDINLI